MDMAALQDSLFFQWLAQHPGWVGASLFLIALVESLALVGLAVPGVVLLAIAAFLAGAGALSLPATLVLGMLGAIAGDCISFWLGQRYHQDIKAMPGFRRYPEVFRRGEEMFAKHGLYGVVLGRFIGPLRPVMPMIAGMLNMPARQFVAVDVISAFAWSPFYLLPFYLMGASTQLPVPVEWLLAGMLGILVVGLLVLPRAKRYLQK